MRRLPLDHPGTADHGSPSRFLWWLVRQQWTTLLPAVALGVVWMLCQAVMPALIGEAIDRGVTTGNDAALLWWTGLMLLVGLLQAVSGIARHRFAVTNWLIAAYRTVQLVARHAVHLGATLPKRVATGELVTIGSSDLAHFGNAMDVTARAAGAVVSFGVVAFLLLHTSTTLGLVVLVGVPVVLLCLGPLLRPLQQRGMQQRAMMAELSNVATDVVAGLRVLRGVGGERVFGRRYARESQRVREAGVQVGRLQSLLDAAQVALPGVFVVVVVWLGARLAASGAITVGELVACYGYAVFLMLPLRTTTEAVNKWIRAYVSARRVCRVLAVTPEMVDPQEPAAAPPVGSELVDVTSGVRIEAGTLVALVSRRPEETAAVVDRLGRYAEGDVRWGGVPLDRLPRAAVRRRIVVSHTASTLFSGTFRDQLDVPQHPAGAEHVGAGAAGVDLQAVLHAASAEDILDAVGGMDAVVVERGRSLSGGQAQRVVLARALAADPEVLLLVEPTSAVDAHTEARIAERLRAHRAGRTTILTSTSPLVLDRVDQVVFLVDGRVAAVGAHHDLLRDVGDYRAVVTREEEVAT